MQGTARRRVRQWILAVFFLALSVPLTMTLSYADSSQPAQPVASSAPSDLVIPSLNIQLKGFVDVYGQYNPTPASETDSRAYDFGANSFDLNTAQIKLWCSDDDGVDVLSTDFGPGAYASAQSFTPGFFGGLGTPNTLITSNLRSSNAVMP